VLFSSGGQNLAGNKFVGVGSVGDEINVQQIMPTAGTATTMRCYMAQADNVNQTFTLRVNGTNSTLTCTILAGQTSGVGTGTATWTAGSFLDVATPGGVPGKPGTFSIS
jgi:hypothetical protein